MVVLRSCSNRCMRNVITMADLSVTDQRQIKHDTEHATSSVVCGLACFLQGE